MAAAYTLARWLIRDGQEDEFVRRWKDEPGPFFLDIAPETHDGREQDGVSATKSRSPNLAPQDVELRGEEREARSFRHDPVSIQRTYTAQDNKQATDEQ